MNDPVQTIIFFDSENLSSIYKMALDSSVVAHVACPILVVYPKDTKGPFTCNETTAEEFVPPEAYITIVINGSDPLDLAKVLVKSFTKSNIKPSVVVFDKNGEALSIY